MYARPVTQNFLRSHFETMYLATARVTLRELTPDDEDILFELDSDPEVMEFLTGGVPSSRDEIKRVIERMIGLTQNHHGRFGYWAALEKESGRFMGWFHFRPSKKNADNIKRIELGYRLQRDFWGKGYATEVSRALIEKGFRELEVEEVFAVTMKTNLRSQNVMRKCGMSLMRAYSDPKYPCAKDPEVEFALVRPRLATG